MKILAIRGCNLASLRGDFEVDLEHPALADGGLFSIGGPTGSGKSTLLDAMCLALYGRTPRLAGGAKVRFEDAHQELAANDPRLLMTRGCAEAWAECDFLGLDGQRHRARWSVRRARNRPAGKFQQVERSYGPLEGGEPLGGKLREINAAIQAAIGLDFEQFCRTVLLAQGQFAAFLDAPAAKRAQLLEAMTGTELYGRISMHVHQQAAEIRTSVKSLERQLAELEPVAEAEVEASSKASQDLKLRSSALRLQLAAVERVLQWQEELDRLKQNADRAAEAAHYLFDEGRTTLHQQEGVTDKELLKIGDQALAQSETAAEHQRQQQHRLTELQQEVRAVQATCEDRQTKVEKCRLREESLQLQVEQQRGWLQSHEVDAQWAEVWLELRPLLERIAEEFRNEANARAEITCSQDRLSEADELRPRCALTAEERATLGGHLDLPLEEFDEILAAMRRAADETATRKELAEHWQLAVETHQQLCVRLAQEEQALAQSEAEHGRVEQELIAARAVAEERRRLREELRLRASFEEHRAHLRAGEACPLCGATEHPWGPQGAAPPGGVSEAEWQEAEQRAKECAQAVTQADRHTAAARTRVEERRAEVDRAARSLEEARDAAKSAGMALSVAVEHHLVEIEIDFERQRDRLALYTRWARFRVEESRWKQDHVALQTRLKAVEEQAAAAAQLQQAAWTKVDAFGLPVDRPTFQAEPDAWLAATGQRVAAVLQRRKALLDL
ncbi:MAG: AAA family ATPase, partial [Myxococcales bacterium]|nr:AAA family ATPase [Myxococcales bacterium]